MKFRLIKNREVSSKLNNNDFSRKKYITSGIAGIMIGALLTGGISVAAVNLTAKDVKYTPSNEKFTATTAEEAMNELYNLSAELVGKSEVIYLGTGTSFNLTSYQGYENFTIDNFIVEPISTSQAQVSASMEHNANYVALGLTLNKSYSNGVLSANVNSFGQITNGNGISIYPTRTFSVKAYLVLK